MEYRFKKKKMRRTQSFSEKRQLLAFFTMTNCRVVENSTPTHSVQENPKQFRLQGGEWYFLLFPSSFASNSSIE